MSSPVATVNIIRYRGDTYPFQFVLQDARGEIVDISGITFRMVADTSKTPADDTTNLFDLAGTAPDPETGVLLFSPSLEDMAIKPGDHFYDIQMIYGQDLVRTIATGTLTVTQDIAK